MGRRTIRRKRSAGNNRGRERGLQGGEGGDGRIRSSLDTRGDDHPNVGKKKKEKNIAGSTLRSRQVGNDEVNGKKTAMPFKRTKGKEKNARLPKKKKEVVTADLTQQGKEEPARLTEEKKKKTAQGKGPGDSAEIVVEKEK